MLFLQTPGKDFDETFSPVMRREHQAILFVHKITFVGGGVVNVKNMVVTSTDLSCKHQSTVLLTFNNMIY